MKCARCGAIAADTKKFCGDCGTPLPWQCHACGNNNPADKRFCGDCGAPCRAEAHETRVVGSGVVSSPERRLLTVMFVDLVGSTALGERLDPEHLRKIIGAFQRTVKAVINQFEGFVARYMGDGVLVYFGYPLSHEADVERAIRAGLTVVEAVEALKTLAGPSGTLKARIGIDTGLVIAGDLIGSGASLEAAVVGDTPNRAARLQATAEPGTVVISDSSRQLVGTLFEFRERELAKRKGVQGTEVSWTVLRTSLVDSRHEALRREQSLLVGRDEELEFLRRRWEQARAGEGRVIFLMGEPGIGKSRMVTALEQSIGTAEYSEIRIYCSPHYLDTPLYPIARHFERTANFEHGDSAAAKWSKLANSLSSSVSLDDKALLADLLSISSPVPDLIAKLRPEQRKAQTFEIVTQHIISVAKTTPLLIVVEDIHWADPTTLELIHILIETIQRKPILLVITARPDVRPAWVGRSHVTVQYLSALDRSASVTLIKQVAGGRELPERVIDRIVAHADGMPLFMEELTKTVLEQIQDSGTREYAPSLEWLSMDVIPRSLHSSLMARLDRLSTGKEVAQIGAVIGRDFTFDLMKTVSDLPAKQLECALAELTQASIIVAHGRAPTASYSFKHALVQDAAFASLLHERRRAVHFRIAEEIEKGVDGETPEPQLIAWHFAEAGAPGKAIDYYQRSAERATGRFALAEMVNHLRNGLRQIACLPNSPERDRRELALQLALGQALIDFEGGSSESVRETFGRARELCLALDEFSLLPRVFDGLVANYHYIRANPIKISEYIGEMRAIHHRTGDPRTLFSMTRAECLNDFLVGDFAAACRNMRSLVAMYDHERDGPQADMTSRDPRAAMSTFLGICLTILGNADAGRAETIEGIYYARKLNHSVSLSLGLRRACLQGMLLRDTERVVQFASELAKVQAAFETHQGNWEGTFFQDWAQLRMKMDPMRFDRVQAFLDHLDRKNIWALLPFYMATAAELSGTYGNSERALVLLDRASEIVNATGSRWCGAEIVRLRARFGSRNSEEAVIMLQESRDIAISQGAKLWELRSATDLASLLAARGGNIEAREVLKSTCDSFIEGRDSVDYVEAEKLLGKI